MHMHMCMHMCQRAHEWVCEQFRKTVRPGSHTAGVAGRLWSEVAVASLKHPWDNKMRLPEKNDENGGKDRRATFDDVGGHNVTTKTILGARVRQQAGVPHGAHHRRILEGGKKRGMRGPATRSAFWGAERARRLGMRPQKRHARQGGESENGETGTTGHKKTVSRHRRRWRTC